MSTTTKGSSLADAAPCGASALDAVAIGDTFDRVGDDGGPWEVTEERFGLARVWLTVRAGARMWRSSASLLDPARWRRVRAL